MSTDITYAMQDIDMQDILVQSKTQFGMNIKIASKVVLILLTWLQKLRNSTVNRGELTLLYLKKY